MRYTLKMAADELLAFNKTYGSKSIRDAINRAMVELADMDGWDRLRKVYRMRVPPATAIALPQEAAALTRVCVNGRPAHIRGQDFPFVHSGPGDLAVMPEDFTRVKNVADLGYYPVMFDPPGPGVLYAWGSAADAGKKLSVRVEGVNAYGRRIRSDIPVEARPGYTGPSREVVPAACNPETDFAAVTSVVLPDGLDGYVDMYWAAACGDFRFVSQFHPGIKVPEFRRYRFPKGCCTCTGDGLADILAEVSLNPLPLVDDMDVLPFPTLRPVRAMIQADWHYESNEPDTAKKYEDAAIVWMKGRELVEDKAQRALVVNSVLELSGAEVSDMCANI